MPVLAMLRAVELLMLPEWEVLILSNTRGISTSSIAGTVVWAATASKLAVYGGHVMRTLLALTVFQPLVLLTLRVRAVF